MKLKLIALAAVLTLSGCAQPYGEVYRAESVGQVRAIGGDVSYYRSNNQVSAQSREFERQHAERERNRPLNAMELDMIEQQRKSQEFDAHLRATQKDRNCSAKAAMVNDQIRLTDFANGGLSYNEHQQRMEQLKSLQKHIYNKCMAN